MMTVIEWWEFCERVKVEGLGCCLAFFISCVPTQCSEISSDLWNSGVSGVGGRSGKFGMECDHACGMCHGTSGDKGIHQSKDSIRYCGRLDSEYMHAFCNYC